MKQQSKQRYSVGIIICGQCGRRPMPKITPQGAAWVCECGATRYTQARGGDQRPPNNAA